MRAVGWASLCQSITYILPDQYVRRYPGLSTMTSVFTHGIVVVEITLSGLFDTANEGPQRSAAETRPSLQLPALTAPFSSVYVYPDPTIPPSFPARSSSSCWVVERHQAVEAGKEEVSRR